MSRSVCILTVVLLVTPMGAEADEALWWSLAPLEAPDIPSAQGDWIRTPIDAFIAREHSRQGLSVSPPADPATLIRRVTYDLHGLPPDPHDVTAFVNDQTPDAYDRLVDRLLASPRYGERWARHWLDVVHYGETHGYDKDKPRYHSWPYRDYVVRAFNEDKPYQTFVEQQLAGDVLWPGDAEGIEALGFIAAGPWDFVGHVELKEGSVDKEITRSLDRDDMLMTAMSTFTSMTVHCARCHDHKFDPMTQRDYYRLQAVFAGVERADRTYDRDPSIASRRASLAKRQTALEERESSLRESFPPQLSQGLQDIEKKKSAIAKGASPSNGYHSAIEITPDLAKWVQVDLGEVRTIDEVTLFPARPVDFADTPGFGFPPRFKVELSSEPSFDETTVVADFTAEDFENPGDDPVVISGHDQTARFVRVTATRLWRRTGDYVFALAEMRVLGPDQRAHPIVRATSLDSIEAGLWSHRHLHDGFSSRGWVGFDESSRDEGPLSMEDEAQRQIDRTLSPRDQETWDALRREKSQVEREQQILPEPSQVYAIRSIPARPISLLHRGDVSQPREEMKPGALACIDALESEFPAEEEAHRRAALARWITSPHNPLTWRSIVNRVWHYHFGRGLVSTPNDFGKMGALPTHPELLDWMAVQFRDGGGSLKDLHRLILKSAVYRQQSQSRPDAALVDRENRYLWRMHRRRLEAESIRDAILYISGNLDLTMGGPSERHFDFEDDHSPRYDYASYRPPNTLRRSLYRFVVRSVPDPFMECLDCPDPSMLAPKRHTTLTAARALALLNDPLILHQCEVFAARLAKEEAQPREQIVNAYQQALGRAPLENEIAALVPLIEDHGLESFARLVFNLSEFQFID